MRSSPNRFPPNWQSVVIFLLVWVSIWICIYLIMLQPLGGIISQKYAVISGGIGLFLTLPFFGMIWYRPGIIKIPPRQSIVFILLQALFFCIIIWIAVPSLRNILLAPATDLILNFYGEKGGFVDITWLKNGLGDISFNNVKLNQTSEIQLENIHLNLDEKGHADLSWSGRVWQEISIVMNASKSVKVTSNIDGQTQIFDYDPKTVTNFEMILPVKYKSFYQQINLLIAPFLFVTVSYLLFLFSIFARDFSSLTRHLSWALNKIALKPLVISVCIAIGSVFGALAIKIVSTGYFNRMYIDDFCYLNIFHKNGLLGAILFAYAELNGRFTSHVLNFIAFSFGKASIPFGPLIAVMGIGGSLFYLFSRLFIVKNRRESKSMKIIYLASFLFSLIVIVTTSLIAPFLYESIDWTLHSLIVTGSLFVVNFFIGLVLFFTANAQKHFNQIGTAFVFALLGFCSMGFSEPAVIFLLAIYGLLVLIFLVYKKIKQYWGIILGFGIGAICGFLMVALSPGSSERVGRIGFSNSINDIFYRLFSLVRMSFSEFFLYQNSIGIFAFIIAMLLGFTLGRTLNINLRFEKIFPRSPYGQFILWLMPFLLTILLLLPSALVKGYLPLRTLYIPIYFLVLQYFLIFVYYGRRNANENEATRLLLVISIISILCFGVIGFVSLENLTKQIIIYADEFDSRETEIFRAKSAGLSQTKITPYTNDLSWDIPENPSHWFVECLKDYYGVQLSLERRD